MKGNKHVRWLGEDYGLSLKMRQNPGSRRFPTVPHGSRDGSRRFLTVPDGSRRFVVLGGLAMPRDPSLFYIQACHLVHFPFKGELVGMGSNGNRC